MLYIYNVNIYNITQAYVLIILKQTNKKKNGVLEDKLTIQYEIAVYIPQKEQKNIT